MVEKKPVGKITHYFSKISVAVVELTDELKVGDEISIEGNKTNFQQKVESMQIEHKQIEEAKANDVIGLKVIDKVREGDTVFKLT
jgi:putative protease